jgi:predicted ester cyclase
MARNSFISVSGFAERQHRWVVCLALVAGLIGIPASVAAGPVLIPMEDDGGNGGMATGGANDQAALRLFDEVLSQKVPEVCALLMAAEAINHTPHGVFTGPAGFERYAAEAWIAFPDATFVIDEVTSGADHLTVRWTMAGRHLGDYGDHQATGAFVRLEGIAILRFEGGMIAESWLQYDRMALADQIEASRSAPEVCPPCEMP